MSMPPELCTVPQIEDMAVMYDMISTRDRPYALCCVLLGVGDKGVVWECKAVTCIKEELHLFSRNVWLFWEQQVAHFCRHCSQRGHVATAVDFPTTDALGQAC